jgi:succinyl-diaminopimelate desuccinylase
VSIVETLASLVEINSVSGQEQALGLYCETFLNQAGFSCQRQAVGADGCFNLLAETGEGSHSLLLYAHLDTVPPALDWQSDPFQLNIDGDRLTGLGVSDMKGGLAVLLEAAQQFRAHDFRLKIALTVDEERWSEGAWVLLRSGWLDDVAATLVPELSIDSPYPSLGLGRYGCFSYRVALKGETAHGAIPGQGLNAILEAACLLQKLSDLPLSRDPIWGSEHLLVREIKGGQSSLSVPDYCEWVVSCLVHPGTKPEIIQAQLEQYLQAWTACQVQVQPLERPTPMAEGYWIEPSHAFVKRVQTIVARFRGQVLPEVMGVSVADENILALTGKPVLSLAPIGGNSHRADEWLSLSSLQQTLTLYQELLRQGKSLLAACKQVPKAF